MATAPINTQPITVQSSKLLTDYPQYYWNYPENLRNLLQKNLVDVIVFSAKGRKANFTQWSSVYTHTRTLQKHITPATCYNI